MAREFFVEALDFLNVPKSDYPDIIEDSIFNEQHKLTPPYLNYDRKTYVIHTPFIAHLHPRNAPTALRTWAYMNAWNWHCFIRTGERKPLEDKESFIFSHALATIKGVRIPAPEPFLQTVAEFMTERLGIGATVIHGFHPKLGHKSIISFDKKQTEAHVTNLNRLVKVSLAKRPIKINRGTKGSQQNPFDNIDEAAEFIEKLELDMLRKDSYRNYIQNENYFFDLEHRCFRIPWASANVAYYDLGTDNNNGFVVNELQSGRFSLKPLLRNHKFLFRGQSSYYPVCKPTLHRPYNKGKELSELMQTYELQALIQTHPLVKLLGNGVEMFYDFFEFEMNYLGLGQHYYNNTEYLDLTSRLDIAKFFAVTTFDFPNDRYIKHDGDGLGVLYFYSIEPDSFIQYKYGTRLSTIGKQVFMRSGNQAGFLLQMNSEANFNELPNVRAIFFRHKQEFTDKIFSKFHEGDDIMPVETLRTIWHKRMSDPDLKCKISDTAVRLYLKDHSGNFADVKTKLEAEGITVVSTKPSFTAEDLEQYYSTALANWDEFVSDIHFYSPEGRVLKEFLKDLPNDPRYRWAFVK